MMVLKRTTRTRFAFFLTADILFVISAIVGAFLLRFEGNIPAVYFEGTIQWTIVFACLCVLPLLYYFNLYRFSWAYVSTEELIALGKAVTIGFVLLGGVIVFFREGEVFAGFPRSVLLMSYILTIGFIGGLRLFKRVYIHVRSESSGPEDKRTLIVGAGDAGEQLVRSLAVGKEHIRPVAFVDDSPMKKGVVIHGVRVVGTIDTIPDVVAEYGIEEMIIALPSGGTNVIKRAVEKGREAELKSIRVVPTLQDIARKGVPVDELREVSVEDLLGRDPVHLDEGLIERFITGKVVLVTGAAGSIGSELCRQVARFRPRMLILFDHEETGVFQIAGEMHRGFPDVHIHSIVGNIQDEKRIDYVFSNWRPEIVFHAAAYKHVPLMEEHVSEAIRNNVFGTLVVAEAASTYNVETFVFISTDKAVNPSSVMGATKRVGEMICQVQNSISNTRFVSVRFGNVLNSRGSVIPLFRERIRKREAVEVTHPDMKRYFMITSEACLLVMEAGAISEGGEVFVLDMGEPVKILDVAKEMIRLSGLEPDRDIPIVFVGTRPGEKLFEEILSAEEGTVVTSHRQILKAKLTPIEKSELQKGLDRLRFLLESSNIEECRVTLRVLVPTYNAQA